MQDKINKPIFVVGSPRSGTSILTWCLGQHPNMFPLPESSCVGDLAINLAICYQTGTARGMRSLLSAMDIQRDEFFAAFGWSINGLILKHLEDLERKRTIERIQRALKDQRFYSCEITGEMSGNLTAAIRRYQIRNGLDVNGQLNAETLGSLAIPRSESKPKTRWVDQTPEYSLHICGLRKLFPQAVFIHLVRDVTAVVRSLLNFLPDGQTRLVANEQAAYEYWLRKVNCCVEAEQAYGPDIVYRLRYSDIVEQPESAMRSLLAFLGEPYAPECLEPLAQRINSANVPVDFNASDPATDLAVIAQARELSDQLQSSSQPREASVTVAEKLESEFNRRVQYFRDLEGNYAEAQKLIPKLQKEFEALKRTADRGTRGCAKERQDIPVA